MKKLSSIKSIPSAKKGWDLCTGDCIISLVSHKKGEYCPYSQFQIVTWCLSQEEKEAIRIDIAPKSPTKKPDFIWNRMCEEIKVFL